MRQIKKINRLGWYVICFALLMLLLSLGDAQARTFAFSDKNVLNGTSWGSMTITAVDAPTLKIQYNAESGLPSGTHATGFGFSFATKPSATGYTDTFYINVTDMDLTQSDLATSVSSGGGMDGGGDHRGGGGKPPHKVPEPGTFVLLGSALVALALLGRRGKRKI